MVLYLIPTPTTCNFIGNINFVPLAWGDTFVGQLAYGPVKRRFRGVGDVLDVSRLDKCLRIFKLVENRRVPVLRRSNTGLVSSLMVWLIFGHRRKNSRF